MNPIRSRRWVALGAATAMLWAAREAPAASGDRGRSLDVACNALTFVFQGPEIPGVGPDYGATFVVQGVIYPGGTFAANGTDSGLNPDGTPQFPDLVVGTWTCRGWFIGDGIATVTGPFVVTTQVYDLDPDAPGAETIVSEGIELVDLNLPFARAVTGGTGENGPRLAGGQVFQTSVGVNATGLFNFSFEFEKRLKLPD